jgi:alcohol dehydrogenase class IV
VLLGPVLAMNRGMVADTTRIDEICAIIAGVLGGGAQDAPATLADWARACGLPGLQTQGLDPARHPSVAEASLASSSMKGNPVAPTVAGLVEVLRAAG